MQGNSLHAWLCTEDDLTAAWKGLTTDSDRRVAASIEDPSAAIDVERENVFPDAFAAINRNSNQ